MFSKKVQPVTNAYVAKVRIVIDNDQFVEDFLFSEQIEAPSFNSIANEVVVRKAFYNKDLSMFYPASRMKSFQVLSITKVQ